MVNVAEYAWWIAGALFVAGTAVWFFILLARRVRRGNLSRKQAAMLLLPTLLLPVPYVFVAGVLYALAQALGPSPSIWAGDAGLVMLGTITLLLGGVGILNVAFWIWLALK